MNDNVLWKIVGKADGLSMVFYDEDDIEYVNTPIEGDVVELHNEEFAIVYRDGDRLRFLTESDIKRMDEDYDSYRNQ